MNARPANQRKKKKLTRCIWCCRHPRCSVRLRNLRFLGGSPPAKALHEASKWPLDGTEQPTDTPGTRGSDWVESLPGCGLICWSDPWVTQFHWEIRILPGRVRGPRCLTCGFSSGLGDVVRELEERRVNAPGDLASAALLPCVDRQRAVAPRPFGDEREGRLPTKSAHWGNRAPSVPALRGRGIVLGGSVPFPRVF